jgi:hypothetical protein
MKTKNIRTPKLTPELKAAEKELALAYKRVGDSPPKQLKWLLDFAFKKLDTLSGGELANIGWEVVAFGVGREKIVDGSNDAIVFFNLAGPDRSRLIKRFQSELAAKFESVTKGFWEINRPALTEKFAIPGVTPRTPHQEEEEHPGPSVYLILKASDLVKSERDRIGICENEKCPKPFRLFAAQRRNRAKFCSSKCSAYVRVNKARGKMVT